MGRGIKLIPEVAKYREELLIKKDENVDSTNKFLDNLEKEGIVDKENSDPQPKKWKNLNNLVKHLGGLTVQKYMEEPSLINGRKFDIRYFMLISCTKPYLVLTNTGYARISLEEYSMTGLDFKTKEDRARHLTNASV